MIERRVAGKPVLPRSRKRRLIVSNTRTKAADLGSAATDAAQNVAQNVAQNATVVAQNAAEAAQSVAHSAAQNAAVVAQNAADVAQSVAHSAAQNAAVVAQNARQSAGNAAQTTASGVKAGVRQGFFNARRWAAPRLEDAADYTTTTAAPAVSSALLATAKKVRPAQETKHSALKWSLLASACLAAAGAVAAAVRYKYRSAMAADYRSAMAADTEVEDTAAADAAVEPIVSTAPTTAEPAEPATDDVEASVNGRVSKDGW
jgi:hypothetical protein